MCFLRKSIIIRNRVLTKIPNLCNPCRRPLIFQAIHSVWSINLSLKYQRFTQSFCKDIGIRKFEFGAKTQFLCLQIKMFLSGHSDIN